jgi:transposase-like protein
MITPPAKLSREIVETARLAVAGGATVREVADRLGVSYEALRKRSQRGGWLTPQRVARATEQRATERATELHATSRAERASKYEEYLAIASEKFAQRTAELDGEELIKKAGGIERLDRVARRTLGLDERADANVVNIALLGNYTDHLTPTLEDGHNDGGGAT